jgi:hypothetical protein
MPLRRWCSSGGAAHSVLPPCRWCSSCSGAAHSVHASVNGRASKRFALRCAHGPWGRACMLTPGTQGTSCGCGRSHCTPSTCSPFSPQWFLRRGSLVWETAAAPWKANARAWSGARGGRGRLSSGPLGPLSARGRRAGQESKFPAKPFTPRAKTLGPKDYIDRVPKYLLNSTQFKVCFSYTPSA